MRFGWVTIHVGDMEKSTAFYRDVVGLEVRRTMSPKPGTEIAFLGEAGREMELELIHGDEDDAAVYGTGISLGFEVPSLDAQIGLLRSKGIGITGPFQPAPTIRFVYVEDPDGLRIQFFQNLGK